MQESFSFERFEEQGVCLENALKRAVRRNPADFHLLSGGIDSSLLAALDPKTPAITVTIQGKGIDLRYAQQTTEFLGINWHHIELSTEEAMSSIPNIIEHLNSYDPGILNDVALYAGMRYARSLGAQAIRTGDGGDDLFGGYSFSWSKDGISLDPEYHRSYLKNLCPHLFFPSDVMAASFEMRATHPYVDPEVVDLALEMDLGFKVQALEMEKVGDVHYEMDESSKQTKSNIWSKLILRRIARKYLPATILRRSRSDLEYGSGSYILEDLLARQINEEAISKLEGKGIKFWHNQEKPQTRKMHARLRQIFEEKNLKAPEVKEGEYACSWCSGGIPTGRNHCFTCGAWHGK